MRKFMQDMGVSLKYMAAATALGFFVGVGLSAGVTFQLAVESYLTSEPTPVEEIDQRLPDDGASGRA